LKPMDTKIESTTVFDIKLMR